MIFSKINVQNNRIINSRESTLYIDKNIVYKIFKNGIDIEQRMKIIMELIDSRVNWHPEIYDLVYKDSMVVGYAMKYYEDAVAFSQSMRFNFIVKKCMELIDIYLYLKNNYNLCYSDFHNGNVYINNSSILLLDIDSCAIGKFKNEQITDRYLCDYVLSMIYKTIFFDYEMYFSSDERQLIRETLYKNVSGKEIKTIEDLKFFAQNITKSDIRRKLKKLPYRIG